MTDQPEAEGEYQLPVPVHQTWWAPLLGALVFAAGGWFQLNDIARLESGEVKELWLGNAAIAIYESSGKAGIIAADLVLVLPLLGLGLYRLFSNRRRLT